MPESWDLLDAIRELVSREGWDTQKLIDWMNVTTIEERIAKETGLLNTWKEYPSRDSQLSSPVVSWVGYDYGDEVVGYMLAYAPPFLRSRDAAAMLEEELRTLAYATRPHIGWHHRIASSDGHWMIQFTADYEDDGDDYWESRILGAVDDNEAAARTLAALEAGHMLGLWPVKT